MAGRPQTNPNSLANLRPGRINLMPKCNKPGCRAPRVKGANRCMKHGGAGAMKTTTPKQMRRRWARKIIKHALRDGRIPVELAVHPVWRWCATGTRCHVRPMMLDAWHSSDPWAWPQALLQVEQELGTPPDACPHEGA